MDSVVGVVQYFHCNVAHQAAVWALRGGGSEHTGGGVDRSEGVEATAASASRLSHTIQTEAASWWQSYMDDSVKLDKSMDLELVLLTYSAPSQMQADNLVTSALRGSPSEAQSYKRFGVHR